jgi:hypothetical protein
MRRVLGAINPETLQQATTQRILAMTTCRTNSPTRPTHPSNDRALPVALEIYRHVRVDTPHSLSHITQPAPTTVAIKRNHRRKTKTVQQSRVGILRDDMQFQVWALFLQGLHRP